MNAARPARRLSEAGDDRLRWAEAIVEEVTDPGTGLVTRDCLERRFAEFELRIETRLAQFETRLTPSLLLTQAAGFGTLAVLALFKL